MTKALFAKLLIVIVVLISACDRSTVSQMTWNRSSNETAIAIEQIVEGSQPGDFILSGSTTLPDQTTLTVSALRRIAPLADENLSAEAARYAILDRKSAQTKDGRWQAQLSLWEVNEGIYQENWQTIGVDINATAISPSVDFWATLEPMAFSASALESQPEILDSIRNPLLNFTPDGKPYLKASQSQVVALPSSAAGVSSAVADETPDPWEGRSTRERADSSLSEEPKILFMEGDNAALPDQNVLR